MKKINVKDWRMMLLVGAAAGALVAAPLGAHALTNQEDDSPDQTQTTTETSADTNDESQATDTPADTTATDTTNTDTQNTPVTQTPDPTNEAEQPGETDTTTSPMVADLQTAITIASAEHPNVQAVSAKLKKLQGNDVYKVVFADGWIAYVSADNGSVLLLQDKDGGKHTCQNRARSSWLKNHKNWEPFDSDYSAYSSAWLAKKNWSAAKHNWQPQQSSTDTQQSSEDSADDTTTTSATQTTSAQKSTSKAYGSTHNKTNSWKH